MHALQSTAGSNVYGSRLCLYVLPMAYVGLNKIKPRHACAVKLTVVVSVCVCEAKSTYQWIANGILKVFVLWVWC